MHQTSIGATLHFRFQFSMAYISQQTGWKRTGMFSDLSTSPALLSPPPIRCLGQKLICESGDLYPIDWDDITEYDGPTHQLDYDMVWTMAAKVQNCHDLCFAFCYFCLYELILSFSVLQHLASKESKVMLQ